MNSWKCLRGVLFAARRRSAASAVVAAAAIAAGLLLFAASAAATGGDSVLGVPCASVPSLQLEKQMNVHAYLVLKGCGASAKERTSAEPPQQPVQGKAAPMQVGGTDKDVINPLDTALPHDTQSESMVAARGGTVVVNYNDSRDSASTDYSGVSYSTNSGSTWTRIDPFATGHGSNFGDPILVYNQRFNKFVAGDLVGGDCGTQGIGTWTSGTGSTWATGPCVHVGSDDDRESIAVDNDPASPYYGNMYVSWNDFNLGNGALVASRSTDGGATWSPEIVIDNTGTFYRDTQLAVQPANGQVDLVGFDEGGGNANPRTNYFFRSTDGGLTWSAPIAMGTSFLAAGDTQVGSFAGFHHIWRATGYGNPVPGGPTTIVYPYYQHGAGSDPGDVYVVRSTDNGTTWSPPVAVSTAPNAQWFAQAVADRTGRVGIWYLTRQNTTDADNYEVYWTQSLDGGATWSAPDRLSDKLIPEPVQNDPNVQPFYAGDYNITTSDQNNGFPSNRLFASWTDGRNMIAVGPPGNYDFTNSTDALSTGGTDIGNHCDDCATTVALPFPVTLYGTSYSSVSVSSNGLLAFGGSTTAFNNTCLPLGDGITKILPYWDDLRTDNLHFTGEGWFMTTTGAVGSRFVTLRERAEDFAHSAEVNFEVRLFENQTRFSIVYGAMPGGDAATVGVENADHRATQSGCNSGGLTSGLKKIFTFNSTEQGGVHTQDVEIDQLPLQDTTPPVGVQITAPPSGPQLTTPFNVTWTAGDPSGPIRYNVQKEVAPMNAGFGGFTAFATNTTATSGPYTGAQGDTECFKVQAVDSVGNASAFTPVRCFGTPLDDASLTPAGGWTAGSASGYYLNTFERTTTQNATLTSPTVTARYIAVVADTCPTCGTIEVYQGATYLTTFVLNSATLRHKQLLVARNSSTLATGPVTIKAISSFGGPVTIDGLAVMRTQP